MAVVVWCGGGLVWRGVVWWWPGVVLCGCGICSVVKSWKKIINKMNDGDDDNNEKTIIVKSLIIF